MVNTLILFKLKQNQHFKLIFYLAFKMAISSQQIDENCQSFLYALISKLFDKSFANFLQNKMKHSPRQRNQYIIYRNQNRGQQGDQSANLKNSYASLDNYSRSPYLQRINIFNNRTKKYERQSSEPAKNTLKVLQNRHDRVMGNLINNRNSKKLDKNGIQDKQQAPYQGVHNRAISNMNEYGNPNYSNTYDMSLKKNNKLKLPRLQKQEPQDNLSSYNSNISNLNEKMQTGSLSSTLEVSTKKKKLQPLKAPYKIHHVTKTKPGSNGKQTKINQDIAIVQTKLPFGLKIYCVCDGHGLNGHLVSSFIRTHLIKNLNHLLKKQINQPNLNEIQQIITNALAKTNDSLLNCDINTELSGSTVVAVFLYQDKILCFNVGDSRAVLASCSDGKNWKITALSDDQKPSRQDQKQRIIKAGGRIQCQRDERGEDIGPLRVWIKDIQMPGLAMTRSFGDKAGIKAGTNGTPQVIQRDLSENDKFMIVASDGVWQYLENEQVVNIVKPYYLKDDIDSGAQRVVKISVEIWQKISFSRDDITVIVVGLNGMDK